LKDALAVPVPNTFAIGGEPVGRSPLALGEVVVAKSVVEDLDFDAVGEALGVVSGVKSLDRFVAGPRRRHRSFRRAFGASLHDQLEVGHGLLHSHHAGGRAGALDFAVFERPGIRRTVDVDEVGFAERPPAGGRCRR